LELQNPDFYCNHMKIQMKLSCAVVFAAALFFGHAQAQNVSNLTDVNGSVLNLQKYSEMVGTPYLYEDWTIGEVTFSNGQKRSNIEMKYDLVEDKPMFKGKDDQPFYFIDPVAAFSLTGKNGAESKTFKNNFPPFKNLTSGTFYEVLEEGKIKLLKKILKIISETKDYNSATGVKTVNEQTIYFLVTGDKMNPLQKKDLKTFISNVDAAKSDAISAFAGQNKLNLKNENDLKKLVAYYNSLN